MLDNVGGNVLANNSEIARVELEDTGTAAQCRRLGTAKVWIWAESAYWHVANIGASYPIVNRLKSLLSGRVAEKAAKFDTDGKIGRLFLAVYAAMLERFE